MPSSSRIDAGVVTPHSWGSRVNSVDALAVSSRVDNGTESPGSLVDGDLDTAWSSKTGDLVGAWVALRLFDTRSTIKSVDLTVGMTKDPDLFVQNVRIAEVSVSWSPAIGNDRYMSEQIQFGPETVLAPNAALDVDSRELQKIPVSAAGRGIVKITVTKVKMGTKPGWRETTISELQLEDDAGKLEMNPSIRVGSFHPQPRGILGIVPEERAPLGCLAAVASVPRVYCVIGGEGIELGRPADGALVSIDKNGSKILATLVDGSTAQSLVPYGAWLKIERELKNGGATLSKTKPGDVTTIPWNGSADVQGVTFRQRTTTETHEDADEGPGDFYNGVLEVRWPGGDAFTKIFDETSPISTNAPPQASLRPVGSMWIVERSWGHGSEGLVVNGAEAVLCDLHAKKCTGYEAPPSAEPER